MWFEVVPPDKELYSDIVNLRDIGLSYQDINKAIADRSKSARELIIKWQPKVSAAFIRNLTELLTITDPEMYAKPQLPSPDAYPVLTPNGFQDFFTAVKKQFAELETWHRVKRAEGSIAKLKDPIDIFHAMTEKINIMIEILKPRHRTIEVGKNRYHTIEAKDWPGHIVYEFAKEDLKFHLDVQKSSLNAKADMTKYLVHENLPTAEAQPEPPVVAPEPIQEAPHEPDVDKIVNKVWAKRDLNTMKKSTLLQIASAKKAKADEEMTRQEIIEAVLVAQRKAPAENTNDTGGTQVEVSQ